MSPVVWTAVKNGASHGSCLSVIQKSLLHGFKRAVFSFQSMATQSLIPTSHPSVAKRAIASPADKARLFWVTVWNTRGAFSKPCVCNGRPQHAHSRPRGPSGALLLLTVARPSVAPLPPSRDDCCIKPHPGRDSRLTVPPAQELPNNYGDLNLATPAWIGSSDSPAEHAGDIVYSQGLEIGWKDRVTRDINSRRQITIRSPQVTSCSLQVGTIGFLWSGAWTSLGLRW